MKDKSNSRDNDNSSTKASTSDNDNLIIQNTSEVVVNKKSKQGADNSKKTTNDFIEEYTNNQTKQGARQFEVYNAERINLDNFEAEKAETAAINGLLDFLFGVGTEAEKEINSNNLPFKNNYVVGDIATSTLKRPNIKTWNNENNYKNIKNAIEKVEQKDGKLIVTVSENFKKFYDALDPSQKTELRDQLRNSLKKEGLVKDVKTHKVETDAENLVKGHQGIDSKIKDLEGRGKINHSTGRIFASALSFGLASTLRDYKAKEEIDALKTLKDKFTKHSDAFTKCKKQHDNIMKELDGKVDKFAKQNKNSILNEEDKQKIKDELRKSNKDVIKYENAFSAVQASFMELTDLNSQKSNLLLEKGRSNADLYDAKQKLDKLTKDWSKNKDKTIKSLDNFSENIPGNLKNSISTLKEKLDKLDIGETGRIDTEELKNIKQVVNQLKDAGSDKFNKLVNKIDKNLGNTIKNAEQVNESQKTIGKLTKEIKESDAKIEQVTEKFEKRLEEHKELESKVQGLGKDNSVFVSEISNKTTEKLAEGAVGKAAKDKSQDLANKMKEILNKDKGLESALKGNSEISTNDSSNIKSTSVMSNEKIQKELEEKSNQSSR